jgi:hypothetical protein
MAEAIDHGALVDHWDTYQARYGELPLHFHKAPTPVLRKLDKLVADCVRRGSPMTREELSQTGYRHPLYGQFY